jgi:2-amino-4-hydroxy-6-hydroxymethyldihydropteridine diphosphokinase
MMHRVALLLGSNHIDKEHYLLRACSVVESLVGRIEAQSAIYYSAPWGFHAEQEFANQALILSTMLEPEQLLVKVLHAEQEVGRDRNAEAAERAQTGERYASRTIDIDVIFYDELVHNSPTLSIPHPRLAEREFALRPLSEIAPKWPHPVTGLTVQQMLNEVTK